MTVLYTVKNYTYSGQATFAINFPLGILSRTHVTIQVNGAVDGDGEPQNYTNFDWVSDAEIIINGLETDDTIVIRRTVPKTQLLTAFGEGKDITRENMDDQAKQAIMVYHEVLDGRLQDVDLTAQIAQVQALIDTLGGSYDGDLPLNKQADIATATINPLFLKVNVGGINYSRRDTNPGHMYSVADAEGNFWEIDNPYYTTLNALDIADVPLVYQVVTRVNADGGDTFNDVDILTELTKVARSQNRRYVHTSADDILVGFDPVDEAFSLPDDDEQIADELSIAFNTPEGIASFRPARQNHNAYEKACRWNMSCQNLLKGICILYYVPVTTNAAIELFGKIRFGDTNEKLYLQGATKTNTLESATMVKLEADPRNRTVTIGGTDVTENAIYRVTATYELDWGDFLQVGKAVGNKSACGLTRADDGAAVLNGAYEVLTKSGDGRTITYDIWNSRESAPMVDAGQSVGLPATVVLGDDGIEHSVTGVLPRAAICNDLQLAPVGGWDGKGFEGYMSFERGAKFRFNSVGMIDYTDTANNPLVDNPGETVSSVLPNDRKMIFLGVDCYGELQTNCTFAGATGSIIRMYGGRNNLYSVHTVMGGLSRYSQSGDGYRLQQNSTAQLIRCTTAGFHSRSLEAGNSCTLSVHQSIFANSLRHIYGIINSSVSTNSALMVWGESGIMTQGIVETTAGTRIYSHQQALRWDGGEVRGAPVLDGNVYETLGDVGPGAYYRGGWWRDIPSLNPPVNIFIPGGRVTARALSFETNVTLEAPSTIVTGEYKFIFDTPRIGQDFNVTVTPREDTVDRCYFEYDGLTGFSVFLRDTAGAAIDADFSFSISEMRDV